MFDIMQKKSRAAEDNTDSADSSVWDGTFLGETTKIEKAYFPAGLIGGCCPRIKGEEMQIAWHAAAEACDSERIHFVCQIHDDKVWYLAARSDEMASYRGSWCPFAALLPGMPDAHDRPVCYTFIDDEVATMMTLTDDGLQIHRGSTSVVQAKAEKNSNDIGAEIIALVPDVIAQMTPAPWHSLSLLEGRARRVLSALLVALAIGIATVSFVVWIMASFVLMSMRSDISSARQQTSEASVRLLQSATAMSANQMRTQLANFAKINESLIRIGGWLKKYEIKNNNDVRWFAVVPLGITQERIREMGAQTLEMTDEGYIIGNRPEAFVK